VTKTRRARAPGRGARGYRLFLALFFLGSAVFNAAVAVPAAREVFQAFHDMAWLSLYRDLIAGVILPNATLMAILLVGFELAVGIAILGPRAWARAGVIAAVVFVLALVPSLAWPYLLANIAMGAGGIWLLRYGHERVVPGRPTSRPIEEATT
jgi:hypothetical protein